MKQINPLEDLWTTYPQTGTILRESFAVPIDNFPFKPVEKKKPLKVYVASPYGRRIGNSDKQCEDNVQKAIEVGRELIKLGYIPLVANLYHFIHAGWADSPDEDKWLEMCMAWIPACDALLRLPGRSHGADAEVSLAKELGIPVRYNIRGLEELRNEKVSS